MFIIFSLLIFGLTGYLLLIFLKNEKTTSIYLICGMSIKQMKKIYILHSLSFTLPTSVIAIIISNIYIKYYSRARYMSLSDIVTYTMPTILVLVLVFIALVIAFYRIKKISILDLQRKGV